MKKTLLLVMVVIVLIMNGMSGERRKPVPGIETFKLTDQIYRLFVHNYVNIFVFNGEQGTLLIDTGFNPLGLIQQELKKIGVEKIRYIINTHSNGDHVNGNAVLAEEAVIISHRRCREDMTKKQGFPTIGLPDLVFDQQMTLRFNREEINLIYLPGHTGNDIVVHFKKAKVVFVGDQGGQCFCLGKNHG